MVINSLCTFSVLLTRTQFSALRFAARNTDDAVLASSSSRHSYLLRDGVCHAPNLKVAPEKRKMPRVLWGIESCDGQAYEDMVNAQLETWAAGIPRENLIIVGGKYDDLHVGLAEELTLCSNEQNALACKEAVVLDRAVSRAKQVDADWLAVGQDDKYIWVTEVEKQLSKYDSTKPMVLSSFGCGKGWKHHPESNNGTLPFPKEWAEPGFSCNEVYMQGGMCGGPVYFMSRGAIDLLHREAQTTVDFLNEYLHNSNSSRGGESDIFTSCMLYKRAIPIINDEKMAGDSLSTEVSHNENPDPTRKGIQAFVADLSTKGRYGPRFTVHFSDVPKDFIAEYIRAFHKEWPAWQGDEE